MLESQITEKLISTLTAIQDPDHWDRFMLLVQLGVVTRDDMREVIKDQCSGNGTAANPLYAPIP